jgi:hypothetical protein
MMSSNQPLVSPSKSVSTCESTTDTQGTKNIDEILSQLSEVNISGEDMSKLTLLCASLKKNVVAVNSQDNTVSTNFDGG